MSRKEPIISEIAYKTWLINEFDCDKRILIWRNSASITGSIWGIQKSGR